MAGKTPWDMAAVGRESSHQSALMAWAAMAKNYGPNIAGMIEAYTVAGWAKRAFENGSNFGQPHKSIPELKWLHAIKNAEKGGMIRGNMAVAEGVRAGVFDTFLPIRQMIVEYDRKPPFLGYYDQETHQGTLIHEYGGLYLELKTPERIREKNGGASDVQLEFQADMRAAGYVAEIAHGWEPGRDILLRYLGRA